MNIHAAGRGGGGAEAQWTGRMVLEWAQGCRAGAVRTPPATGRRRYRFVSMAQVGCPAGLARLGLVLQPARGIVGVGRADVVAQGGREVALRQQAAGRALVSS